MANLTLSANADTLLACANFAAMRTALGLGTLATQSGTFSGTSSGTNTGDQTTITGNAGTATTLQTARAINGVSFDGSAAITVTAAAGTLTGATLNATVTGSSLTSVGTIGTGTWQGTIIAPAYLGTGSSITTKYLRGDGTWQTISGGGDALTSGNLSQFAATTSAQLAGVISDETGSGALVFGTSPTLTTPNLGTPSTLTLTNATGLPIVAGTTGTLSVARGGTGLTAVGSALQVLRTNAGATALEWAAAASGGGDLVAANNLSDVASVPTARANLKAQPRGDYFYDIVDYTTANQRNGTDDATTAVQTALDAIQAAMLANDGGRYVLWLGDAILKITGALQTTNGNNAQLMLPAIGIEDHQCTLEIRGAGPVSSSYSVVGTLPTPTKGAIIRSTLATGGGTRPCVIGGKPPSGSAWTFSMLNLFLINVEVQTIENPLISGIDCSFVGGLEMINSSVTTGEYNVNAVTTPTTATSYGVIGPEVNNGVYSHYRNAAVCGFYTGFKLNEHSTGDLLAFGCLTAVEVGAAYHGSTMTRIGSVHCKTVLRAPTSVGSLQSARWNVDLLMIEHAASGPFVPVNDIEDANNHLKGKCAYAVVLEDSGESSVFVKNGGTNFECRALGDNVVPVWGALSGTTPALVFANTPKIGTLTLTGNTTFTASGYAQGREYTLYLTGATSTRTLAFPDWTWGGTEPADIAATETMQIKLVCTGSTEQSVFATSIEGTTALSSGFTITDTFTRSDSATTVGTSSSGHPSTAVFGTWGISSNKAYVAVGDDTGTNLNIVTWDNGSADATVQADVTTPGSGGYAFGLALRVADVSNMLFVELNSTGELALYKRIANTYTNLTNVTAQGYATSTTYALKAVMSGTSIEVFVGGVSKLTYNTTTTLEAETAHGLQYYHGGGTSPGGRFDNLSITTP